MVNLEMKIVGVFPTRYCWRTFIGAPIGMSRLGRLTGLRLESLTFDSVGRAFPFCLVHFHVWQATGKCLSSPGRCFVQSVPLYADVMSDDFIHIRFRHAHDKCIAHTLFLAYSSTTPVATASPWDSGTYNQSLVLVSDLKLVCRVG